MEELTRIKEEIKYIEERLEEEIIKADAVINHIKNIDVYLSKLREKAESLTL